MLKNIAGKLNRLIYSAFTTRNHVKQLIVYNKSGKSRFMSTDTTDEILIENVKDKGIITLNRPENLNALNHAMIKKIYLALKEWESNKKFVIMQALGDKVFCAGGDAKAVVIALNKQDGHYVTGKFIRDQYTLDYLIGTYKIPYIAVINGITMGGGAGLSVNGKYRIATENTVFAMPEAAIGLYPDAGGSYFLSRLKGKLGLYLGLTGHRLNGIDVFYAGIATHFVSSKKLSDLRNDLLNLETDNIDQVLNKYHKIDENHQFSLAPHIQKIDKFFSAPSVEEIINRLNADDSEWAKEAIQKLLQMSPTSLKITKKSIEEGSKLTLGECLKIEYRLTLACLHKGSEFYEGITALLIRKDKKPNWNPNLLNQVTDELINKRFQKLPDEKELQF